MNQPNKPNFVAWSLENLARFASEAFDDMTKKAEELERIRLDNKVLLDAIRNHWLGENK
jgi:hypothetical protein